MMFSFSVIFTFLLLFGVLNVYVDCLQINVKRKNHVQLNGVKIDANTLRNHLEEYEKELIFGKSKAKGEVKLVQIERRDSRRHKRSTERDISLQIQDNGKQFDLQLQQAEKLIDDAFIFIRRNANTSQFIEDSHKLAVNFEKCFYRNANSALDLCDESSLRGIVYHNSTHYLVHPLPERFGSGNHVIVEFNGGLHSDVDIPAAVQFEPQKEAFNEPRREPSLAHERSSHRNRYGQHRLRKSGRGNHIRRRRRKRQLGGAQWENPKDLHIETAIFVDRDLFVHMKKNFPSNTESHLIRFVLAMINGVQLLYNHPSLGHKINFVLKRLEILNPHPTELRQSSDIDVYLNNFCMWQRNLNPPSDADRLHYDHAVILTGLDLYVIGKSGQMSNQVVGLAPVAGMCTTTSSCTINEGKHFESVFVVAHEIGHNLGMRHDTNENSCDPSLYIMSPTLGSGKITWSKCSRTYLRKFLESSQSKCLYNRGKFNSGYDHAAGGMLPGQRFDADQQCMLKYGKDSVRSRNQIISDICRDLHCQRDRYTWTSHPALEGTECGEMMWCHSGVCVMKATLMGLHSAPRAVTVGKQSEKTMLLESSSKAAHLTQGYNSNKPSVWNEWGNASDCDSGCLYGSSGRLREGSTGLKTYVRTCLDHGRRCQGRDKKYESCSAKQCFKVAKTTIEEHATYICARAQKFDPDLTGEGLQIVGDAEESCKVFCKTKTNGTKSRNWIFPHGTTCRSKDYNFDDTSYCVDGRCERFSCENSTKNYFKIDPYYCPKQGIAEEESRKWNNVNKNSDENRNLKNYRGGGVPIRSKYENEVLGRNFHTSSKWKQDPYRNQWKYPMSLKESTSAETEWEVKSGCHSSCMEKSKGVQVISSKKHRVNSIQLCTHHVKPCDRLQTTTDFAETTCSRYKLKVRGLSGYGMQISPSVYDPDRSCRVACQDEVLQHRFYIVNGNYGHFPLGTKCSVTEERYCVNGKCLEFGANNIALTQSHIRLALFRNRRDITATEYRRKRRSFAHYAPVNITETLTQDFINNIINSLNDEAGSPPDDALSNDHIEFTNPIHIQLTN